MAAQVPTTHPPLSPSTIERLPPGDHRDTGARGLFLRVTPKGTRTFRWFIRSAGRAVTMGRWSKSTRAGCLTLNEARVWLEKLKEAHAVGRLDERVAELHKLLKPPAPAPVIEASGPTFEQVANDFLKHIDGRRKRPEEVRRTVENELIPAFRDRTIASITPRDIRLVVEAVVQRGAPTQAGRVLAHAKQLFRFACGRDELAVAANPAYPLDPDALGVVNNECQRFLSIEEIPLFLRALDASRLTQTVKMGMKVLLYTGVRTQELIRAKWDEVDFDEVTKDGKDKPADERKPTWTIPVANQKLSKKQEQKARPWAVPLTPPVVALFKKLLVFADGSEWVMASPHGSIDPEAGYVHVTEKALCAGMRKLFEGENPFLTFEGERPTPHDLRRTMRTHLEESLGVDENTAERCLNHSRGKVLRTYAVADLLPQRRAALEAWAGYIEQLLTAQPAKVVSIKTRGAR